MNQPIKVLVIQKAAAGWLVQTVGGRVPDFDNVFDTPEAIAQALPELMQTFLRAPLPPQPETPPKDGE